MQVADSYTEHDLRNLKDFLTSEDVNEVVVNSDGRVWVEYGSAAYMEPTDRFMSASEVRSLGIHLAGDTNNELGDRIPLVSGRIRAFGQSMRIQVIVPPAVEEGICLTIRKYMTRMLDLSTIEYVSGTGMSSEQVRLDGLRRIQALAAQANGLPDLLSSAIEERFNILVSGGTSSGKTTTARALLAMCHSQERIVTIEDAPELHPTQKNCVSLIADRVNGSQRSPARLLEASLRLRPDRLLLGEIRGGEAYSYLEAINTGHPGSITTIHADSPDLAFDRLALMIMSLGINMSRRDVIDYAMKTIDIVIQVGRIGGKRGITEVFVPRLQAGAASGRLP
jgi:type IV secretion system protein VirB11